MKMKKILAAATAAILLFGIAATPEVGSEIKLALTANAESGEVPIDETHFPDEVFRKYVFENCDTNKNRSLSDDEIAAVKEIDVTSDPSTDDEDKIKSLEGIENFTALTSLNCFGNKLTTLNVSKNTALTHLDCQDNQITLIDVSGCIALNYFDCSFNMITSLDVRQNIALDHIRCEGNKLTELDLSENIMLEYIGLSGNKLTELDLSENIMLEYIELSGNQLTSLDVSKNTELEDLSCCYNNIKSLDISNNRHLVQAYLDTKKECCTDTGDYYDEYLYNVEIIDDFTYYSRYRLSTDRSTKIIAGIDPDFKVDVIPENFPDDNFRAYILNYFDTDKDEKLSAKEIYDVESIYVSSMNIKSLKGIEYFSALTVLHCDNNQLTELNVSKNNALQNLGCSKNQIISLDIRNNPHLITVYQNGETEKYDMMISYKYLADKINFYLCVDNSVEIIDGERHNAGTADVSGMQNNPNVDVTDMDITFTDDSGKTYNAQVQANGKIMLPSLPAGEYTVTASLENCPSRDYEVTVESGKPVELEVELKLYGDVDGNGLATTADLSLINEQVQMLSELSDYDSKVADVNGDGIVTTSDLSAINEHVQLLELMW